MIGMRGLLAATALTAMCAVAPMSHAQGKGEVVKIQDYPGVGNMLMRIAISKGYCEAHGIKCQLQMIPSGPLGAQALMAKSIDVGFFGPEIQINAMTKGSKLKAITSGATLNVFHIVVGNSVELPNAANGFTALMTDLKGKKIGVPARGSAGELQFLILASKAGLKADDFTFVAVGAPNTSFGALTSKQIDASMTFEPSATLCDVLKACKTVYRANEAKEPVEIAGTNGAASNFVITQETADASPHVVDALIAAAKDAEAFIQDPKNFDEALKVGQSYFKFEMPKGDEVMAASLKSSIPAYKTAITRSALKQIADNMLAAKQLEAPFDTTVLTHPKAP
ncbi:MAG: ABC transporter substrate-binding protein [Hyphomicrobiaceae bacterium]